MVEEGTTYTTTTGVVLQIGRIPRQVIDKFVAEHPHPEPPMVAVETWAGDTEDVPNYNAPEYQQAMLDYYVETDYAQIDLVVDAVHVVSGMSDVDELQALGLAPTKASQLLFLTQNPVELRDIVEEVFYNSTVTPRGVMEAVKLFGVKWSSKLVSPFTIQRMKATANGVYGDQLAARWNGYAWEVFCELPGPRQSEIVTLYRLDNRLQTLMLRVRGK